MKDYTAKLIEQVENDYASLKSAILKGSGKIIGKETRRLVRSLDYLYESVKKKTLAYHLLKTGKKLKDTREFDKFESLFDKLKEDER